MPIESYPNSGEKLRVFICHAHDDKPDARILHDLLVLAGVEPWLDEKRLVAGTEWEPHIEVAVQASDACVVLLSNLSTTKEGYVQREIRLALQSADRMPEGALFVLPMLLEELNVPQSLRKYHYATTFEDLLHALTSRAGVKGKARPKALGTKKFTALLSQLRQMPDRSLSEIERSKILNRHVILRQQTEIEEILKKDPCADIYDVLICCPVCGFIPLQKDRTYDYRTKAECYTMNASCKQCNWTYLYDEMIDLYENPQERTLDDILYRRKGKVRR